MQDIPTCKHLSILSTWKSSAPQEGNHATACETPSWPASLIVQGARNVHDKLHCDTSHIPEAPVAGAHATGLVSVRPTFVLADQAQLPRR